MGEKRNAKGEGAFKENPDGTVTHRKTVDYKENGQRKVFTVTASTKAACLKEMKKKEDAWRRQNKAEGFRTVLTITELCEMHLRYQIEQEELKPKSIDRRECTIGNHIAPYPLGRMQLQAVKVSDIDSHAGDLMKAGRLSVSSIFHNTGLEGLSGGLHIFRRTFATRMYEKGMRTKEIAAYIGDLESTTEKYYIAVRKKRLVEGKVQQVVELPEAYRAGKSESKSEDAF